MKNSKDNPWINGDKLTERGKVLQHLENHELEIAILKEKLDENETAIRKPTDSKRKNRHR